MAMGINYPSLVPSNKQALFTGCSALLSGPVNAVFKRAEVAGLAVPS